MNADVMIRKAERQDVPLLLEFIRGIARFGKMEDGVIASAEVLEREMFDEHRSEAVFAVVDGREVGFALYFYNFSTFIGHSGLYLEGKIFLHIWLESPEPTCAVKLEPEFGQSLREHYEGVRPAYHLNKTHWNDIYLDRIDDELTKQWIRQSYELVLSKLPKKLREKYI